MKAIERIKLMRDIEVAARDAVAEALKATNDPAAIAGLVTEFLGHCMAVGAFVMALEAIEEEVRDGGA
jgi:hypothetical protein